jgi:glycosyltransferase involved in cell wall biosynthesis
MITYGHEKFIEQAINGVLMQLCDFEIELILANDCSADKTNDIIKNILKSHPKASLINYIKHEKNIGMMPNFIFALEQCKAEYIALCEGDDYWTDPLKLQKQVDFLASNEEFNICFHRANLLENEFKLKLHPIPKCSNDGDYLYKDLLEHYNFMLTASVLFRRPNNFTIPKWLKKLPFGDLGLYKLVSNGKKIKCLDENMSVYRIHCNGAWSGLDRIKASNMFLNFYQEILPHLNLEEKEIVNLKIKEVLLDILKLRFPQQLWIQKVFWFYQRCTLNFIKSKYFLILKEKVNVFKIYQLKKMTIKCLAVYSLLKKKINFFIKIK